MKKLKSVLIKTLVSAILFYLIFQKVDRESLFQNLNLFDLRFVPLIITLIVANYVVSSIRWKSLLIHENSEHITVGYLTSLYFIGSFFNNFMPTSMGGDVYKIFALGKSLKNSADALAATFMERFTGMIVLVLISYFGFIQTMDFWISKLPVFITSSSVLVALFQILVFTGFWLGTITVFLSMKFLAKKISFIRKVYESFLPYKRQRMVLFYALFTSLIVQLIAIFTQYFVFSALGYTIPLWHALFMFPVVTLAGFFIPSLNGLGVQDALYVQFFQMVGIPMEVCLGASIMYHLFRLGVSLVGGVLYAMGKDSAK